jgi:hypothetical protein
VRITLHQAFDSENFIPVHVSLDSFIEATPTAPVSDNAPLIFLLLIDHNVPGCGYETARVNTGAKF